MPSSCGPRMGATRLPLAAAAAAAVATVAAVVAVAAVAAVAVVAAVAGVAAVVTVATVGADENGDDGVALGVRNVGNVCCLMTGAIMLMVMMLLRTAAMITQRV